MAEKKLSKGKKIAITAASVVFVLISGIVIYAYSMLSGIKQTDISKAEEPQADSGIEEYVPLNKVEQKTKKITNIALFGLDRRYDEPCRSDTMMVLTIDETSKKIKLTSLMRDIYVDIPGREGNRLNAAYAFGGPGLAINTINQNFDLDIQYYATVDFKALSRLIDKLGGVEIDVKPGEVSHINGGVDDLNSRDKEDQEPHISGPGLQNLQGKQAVSYMRIRKYGNADFERTERQRAVLEQIFEKTKKAGILKIPDLLSAVLPYVETNMSKADILNYGITCAGFGTGIEQYRLPLDGTFKYESIRGMSVLMPLMEKNVDELHKFIYREDDMLANK